MIGTQVSLKVKILGGFMLLIAIMAVVTAGSFWVSSTVENHARLAKEESAVFATVAHQMKLDVVQVQQWLSDISATRAQDGLDDGFDEAEKSYRSFIAGAEKFLKMYRDENDRRSLNELNQLLAACESYYQVGQKMAHAYIDGGPDSGNKVMAEFDQAAATLSERLTPFIEQQTLELDSAMATSSRKSVGYGSLLGSQVC